MSNRRQPAAHHAPPEFPGPSSAEYTVRNAAKALVFCGNRVLVTAERHANGTRFWTLPGGGVEAGETFRDCLRRELLEELRCLADAGEYVTSMLYAHQSRPNTVSRYAVFDCSLRTTASENPTEGIEDWRLARPSALPPGTLPQVRWVIETATR